MCSFMSLRVVNLDNRPFYTVVKQIIKKQKQQWERRNIRGWMWMDLWKRRKIFSSSPPPTRRRCAWVGAGWKSYVENLFRVRTRSESVEPFHPVPVPFFSREQHIEKICNGTIKSSGTFFFSPPRSTPDRPTLPIRWCVRSISRCPLKL